MPFFTLKLTKLWPFHRFFFEKILKYAFIMVYDMNEFKCFNQDHMGDDTKTPLITATPGGQQIPTEPLY